MLLLLNCIHVAVSSIPPCCMSLSVVVNIMWFHLIIPEEFVQCRCMTIGVYKCNIENITYCVSRKL